jgi:outer membrane protein OmpA-like peptidoglycan-associated protein
MKRLLLMTAALVATTGVFARKVKIQVDMVGQTVDASGVHGAGNFATGSANIQGSDADLHTIYNLLVQAEQAKLKVVGYTDNTGNPSSNLTLSKDRAQSVVTYLTNMGISSDRFQTVDGKGDANPVGDNNTTSGKAKNRRVEITLLQ